MRCGSCSTRRTFKAFVLSKRAKGNTMNDCRRPNFKRICPKQFNPSATCELCAVWDKKERFEYLWCGGWIVDYLGKLYKWWANRLRKTFQERKNFWSVKKPHHNDPDENQTEIKPSTRKRGVLWYFCHYSGLRSIWHKAHPPITPPAPPPSTLVLWFIGIYVALFGLVSQQYENRLDRLQNRVNSIHVQYSTDR